MKIGMRVLVLSLLLFPAVGIAGECRAVNLTTPGRVFHGIPTYNQEGAQICFAYTAVQLIEGQRVLQGHTYSRAAAISPLSIALAHALVNGYTDLQQGGITCEAVEAAVQLSVCPSSKSFSSTAQIDLLVNEFKRCKSGSGCQKISAKLGATRAREVLKQNNPLVYVRAVEELRCLVKDRVPLRLPVCERINEEKFPSRTFQDRVDLVFDSANPRPVEIGYSMHLLSYTGNPAKKYVIKRVEEPDGDLFSLLYKPHASILLGRRMKEGRCQYLLRNSQGASFCPSGLAAANKWECDATSEGVWINAPELFDATFEVSNFR